MQRPPVPELRKSSGAFDLPSIITGVVVVGILAAGVLAAIFGVIPFAQDRGAKQDLSSIRTAEGVAKAKDNRFLDHAGLLDTGYLQPSSTEKTTVKADAKGTCYVGLAKSGTGKIFYSTDAKTDPEVFEADTYTGCLTPEELAELIEEVGGIEAPKGAPKNLKLTAVSAIEAKGTWDQVKGADGYKVEYRVGDATDWTLKTEKTTSTSISINALPEQTVSVQVYALTGDKLSEPSAASVKLPDSVLKNPSFESGADGWLIGFSNQAVQTDARTGKYSAAPGKAGYFSQVVTIPAGTPALTFWHSAFGTVPTVSINGTPVTVAMTGAKSGSDSWKQSAADLSTYAGSTVTLRFAGGNTLIDDVALEAPRVPSTPQNLTVVSSSGSATASWVAPVFSGGGIPVTGYTVTAFADGKEIASVKVAGDARTATISRVDTGSSYTFQATASNDAGSSAPSAAFGPVQISAGAIANPGFESGTAGWLIGFSNQAIQTDARTGKYSAAPGKAGYFSQVVTIPAGTPALTFWHSAFGTVPTVSINGTPVTVAMTGAPSGSQQSWKQSAADLTAYAGSTVTLRFAGGTILIDDLAFEAKR